MQVWELAKVAPEEEIRITSGDVDIEGFMTLMGEQISQFKEFEWLMKKEVLDVYADFNNRVICVEVEMTSKE